MGLAARGARNMDNGPERVGDPAELARHRRQATVVYMKSLALGAALTALCLALPV